MFKSQSLTISDKSSVTSWQYSGWHFRKYQNNFQFIIKSFNKFLLFFKRLFIEFRTVTHQLNKQWHFMFWKRVFEATIFEPRHGHPWISPIPYPYFEKFMQSLWICQNALMRINNRKNFSKTFFTVTFVTEFPGSNKVCCFSLQFEDAEIEWLRRVRCSTHDRQGFWSMVKTFEIDFYGS